MDEPSKLKLQKDRIASAKASKGISEEAIYLKVMKHIKDDINSKCDLLDFGAGSGNLIKYIYNSGFKGNFFGADIMAAPREVPEDVIWIKTDLNYPLDLKDNLFDLIISIEVIEHLENPRDTFREFYRLLRPGGKLVVTTPNQESIRAFLALLFKGHFVAFSDASYPAHITALLRKDFLRICNESDFDSPSFFYTDKGGIPKLPRVLWQQISFNLLKGRLFSDNLILITNKSL